MSDETAGLQKTDPAPEPVEPKGLDASVRGELEGRARELAGRVVAAPEDRGLGRELAALGTEPQRSAGRELELMKTRVGTLLDDLDGPGARIPEGLTALRRTMDSINPHLLSTQPKGFFSRLLRRTPLVGDVLADIAIRYESVQTQIDVIVGSLREGKDGLLQDSLELERIYSQVQAAQVEVQKAAYLGELVWGELETKLATTPDPNERQRLSTVVHRVAMRVQDLRTMEQVNTQFFVGIDMTIQNNDHLSDAITRTVTVTRSLLTVGLAIQAALARQKKITKAVQETQQYTSDMLEANAQAIRQQTAEVGDLYQSPVLALDKVKSAYDELIGAMDEMDEIRRVGTERAREGIGQLKAMTEGLAPRAEALRAAREFETPDVEEP